MAAEQTSFEILTVAQVAEYLGCHSSTIYRLLKRREIPGFKLGSDWRFLRAELERWCLEKTSLQTKEARHRGGKAS